MEDPDSSLIAEVAAGDEDAFEQLVKKYERPVLSTIYRYIGDAFSAQDLAQEVFIKVWKKAASFKAKSKFSTWLYRIVVNHCLNYHAKRRRKAILELTEFTPDPNPGIAERLEAQRKSEIVREAVRNLPERQRMALVLSKFEDKSYAEISEIMKTSLSSVESLIFRAKNNLKKHLLSLRERGEI
jgi:RNA polymerase sigma factor (sigma-70 family)